MTHDVDALVKRLEEASQACNGAAWRRADGGQELNLASASLDAAATALQAEHEARVKAETERDAARERGDRYQSIADHHRDFISELKPKLATSEARATAAEAQLASAREALGVIARQKTVNEVCADFGRDYEADWEGGYDGCVHSAREALRSIPAPAAGGEAPESNRCRDGHNFITVSGSPNRICRRCAGQEPPSDDAPSPQSIGQGLSEKGQNVSEARATHEYVPDRKYPWFCAKCGYARHESLMHPAALTAQEKTDG